MSVTSFTIQVDETAPGDEVMLVGDVPELGSWDPGKAPKMNGDKYPVWRWAAQLAENKVIRYKYLIRRSSGTLEWEDGPNRARTIDGKRMIGRTTCYAGTDIHDGKFRTKSTSRIFWGDSVSVGGRSGETRIGRFVGSTGANIRVKFSNHSTEEVDMTFVQKSEANTDHISLPHPQTSLNIESVIRDLTDDLAYLTYYVHNTYHDEDAAAERPRIEPTSQTLSFYLYGCLLPPPAAWAEVRCVKCGRSQKILHKNLGYGYTCQQCSAVNLNFRCTQCNQPTWQLERADQFRCSHCSWVEEGPYSAYRAVKCVCSVENRFLRDAKEFRCAACSRTFRRCKCGRFQEYTWWNKPAIWGCSSCKGWNVL